MNLTTVQISAAATLWRFGLDTYEIHLRLGVPEASIHNALPRIRELARAFRRPALKAVRT